MAKTGADAAIAIAQADHRAWHHRGDLSEREHREMRSGLVRSYFADERRWPNWCAAFVANALEAAGVPVPRKGAPRRGAQALTRWVAKHGSWALSPQSAGLAALPDSRCWELLKPGDVICWRRPPLGWRGHVALILRVYSVDTALNSSATMIAKAGTIEIAEGNAHGGNLAISTWGPEQWPKHLSGLYGVARPNYGGNQ